MSSFQTRPPMTPAGRRPAASANKIPRKCSRSFSLVLHSVKHLQDHGSQTRTAERDNLVHKFDSAVAVDAGHTYSTRHAPQTHPDPLSKDLPTFSEQKVSDRQLNRARCVRLLHHCSGCGSSLEMRHQRCWSAGDPAWSFTEHHQTPANTATPQDNTT